MSKTRLTFVYGNFVAALTIVLLTVASLFIVPYCVSALKTSMLSDEWTAYNTGGVFNAGTAVCLNTRIIYSTPTRGSGDIVTLENGRITPLIATENSVEIQPALSPDHKQLAFVRQTDRSSAIWIMDLRRGDERQITFPDVGRDYYPRIVQSGRRVRFLRWSATSGASGMGELREVDLNTGQESSLGSGIEDRSADGRMICRATININTGISEVIVEDLEERSQVVIGSGYHPRFDSTSQSVVYIGDWREPGLFVSPVNGGPARKLCSIPGFAAPPVVVPDAGTVIITWANDEQGLLWHVDIDTGQIVSEVVLPCYVVRKPFGRE